MPWILVPWILVPSPPHSALEAAPANAVLLSNLSATHLALKQWSQALQRSEECMAADPTFLKAYGRKAAAQMGLIR